VFEYSLEWTPGPPFESSDPKDYRRELRSSYSDKSEYEKLQAPFGNPHLTTQLGKHAELLPLAELNRLWFPAEFATDLRAEKGVTLGHEGMFSLDKLLGQLNRTKAVEVKAEGETCQGTGKPDEKFAKNGALWCIAKGDDTFSALSTQREGEPDELGDVRLKLKLVAPETVTVISGVSSDGVLEGQVAEFWAGKHTIDWVSETESVSELLSSKEKDAKANLMVGRVVGFLLVWFGVYCILYPLEALPSLLPVIGEFISGVMGFLITVFSFLQALAISMIVCGIAWAAARPSVGGPIVGGAVVIMALTTLNVAWFRKPGARKAAAPLASQGAEAS
jgi:hypothetical protein